MEYISDKPKRAKMKKTLTMFWTTFLIAIILGGAWVAYADIKAAIDLNASPIPEPLTILLIGSGLIGFVRFVKQIRSG